MNPRSCFLLVLTLCMSLVVQGQDRLDSIIANLRPASIPSLNQQLVRVFDHLNLAAREPDRTKWPSIREALAWQIDEKTADFDPMYKAVVNAYLAEMFVRERQLQLGYARLNDASRLTPSITPFAAAYVFMKTSDVFKSLNRLDSATWYAEKVLDLASVIRNDSVEKASLDQVALLCYRTRNYPKSEYYFKKLDAHPLTVPTQRRDYNNTIGLTFRNRQMYDSARYYFNRALELAQQLADPLWLGLINGNIGYTYYMQKDYDRALPALLLDVRYSFHGRRNYESALKALSTVTNIYLAKGDMPHAQMYYDSLIHNARFDGSILVRLEVLRTSAGYFEKTGDFRKATYFLHSYSSLADSLQEMENSDRASELEAQFDFDRQLRKIETLEAQTAASAAASRQKNFFIAGALVVVLLLGGLLYLLYRSYAFKNNVNKLLQRQNKLISEQATYLNHLNETKDKLFSIISHDLRGPINSLKALMGMVQKDMITPAEFKHFSAQLQKNVEYVHFTLDNVLYWSRSQLQGLEARPQPVAVCDLVTENLNLFSEPLQAKNIQAHNHVRADVNVMADPNQVRLVFRNLISNAIKFTAEGGAITVSSYADGSNEVLCVSDTGVGINAETVAKLFRESSPSTAGTSGEKGTGLGLSLCREMVEKNKGTIWVESEPGKGSSFKFTLPKV